MIWVVVLALACRGERGGEASPNDSGRDSAPVGECTEVWYADADADGYGNPDLSRVACEPPNEFFLGNGDDCDDTRASVFPGAQEYCDGIDDDCDGEVDEADALDQGLVYVDADGDGAGDPHATSIECGVPEGFAAEPNDCDDTNAAMSPLLPEICNDGIDGDCDGSAAPCGFGGEKGLGLAEAMVRGAEGDHLGFGMAAGDVDGDGIPELVVQGGQTSSIAITTKAYVYLLQGPVSGIWDAPDSAFATIHVGVDPSTSTADAEAFDVFDLDGDGYDDVVAGNSERFVRDEGIYAFLAPLSGTYETAEADYWITGDVGRSFERLGDLDGDGDEDFAAADIRNQVVYIVPGPFEGNVSTGDLSASVAGPSAWCPGLCGDFGAGIGRAGDLDGDGVLDLAIGSPLWTTDLSTIYPSLEGAVFVYPGPFESAVGSDAAVSMILGSGYYRSFGTAFEIVPDLDGDGYDDLVFGNGSNVFVYAPSNPGQAGVFYGPVEGELSTVDADFLFEGEGGDASGASVAVADADGDGFRDLVVGDSAEDGAVVHSGAVFVVAGPLGTGTVHADDAMGRVVGIDQDDAGSVVRNLGDLNGDGIEDIGIGAPAYHATEAGQGAAFVVFGGGM